MKGPDLPAHGEPARGTFLELEQRGRHRVRVRGAGQRTDLASAARRLGISNRTLRRGLESESTTFRAVRDGVLREVAEALPSSPALKVEAVALSMGFADVAAFSKAFKRWVGRSPSDYRTQVARDARPPAQ